ncbi:hypothetical protein CHGG_07376 [Chaetomium globosum CBS 148.51]|uniref:Major facilitator superfamily (MFS) profile domain-containing protein n=1 Tax=Chaetomium globosum (strain ATCC 6205 / CBS 148.51 / DSM 1962 / NBRC 6347 / NRRL 1970) TaxID=306901 RepID=Q2GXC8_CHAGB|nr:uncharacterized protein CHGG_07376 [Chaetomium globosum CBS 148.51]EAQ86123.1 hypothetical protein CHGG_07376 [Chaetomium globosum CBS 148.51]
MEKGIHDEGAEKKGPIVTTSSSSSSSSTKSETAPSLTDNHRRSPSPASPQIDYTVVSFEPNDRTNPHNWSTLTKSLIFLSAFLSTTTTSFSSTLPSNFAPSLPTIFAVADPSGPQRVLPASLYLAGYVFGPLVWAPLSESPLVGRWRVLAVGAGLFVVMSLGQAAVREGDWVGFLVLRFLGGVVASPPKKPADISAENDLIKTVAPALWGAGSLTLLRVPGLCICRLLHIFPRIFQGVYDFTPGISGIMFTIMGLGTVIGSCLFVWYDGVAPRLSAKHPTQREEYLRLPLVCAGGPVYVAAMLWLGWTARADIHWMVPLSAMVPYGLAYHLIYVGIVNYVADAYGIYSASALAAMSMTRSVLGTLLPLAVEDMADGLGIAWSCTLLAGVSAGLALVPFGFVAFGERIRRGSRFSASLRGVEVKEGGGGEDREGGAAPGAGVGVGVGLGRVTSLSAV